MPELIGKQRKAASSNRGYHCKYVTAYTLVGQGIDYVVDANTVSQRRH